MDETSAENAKYGVCIIDIAHDGTILNADKGFCEMTGYELSELKNENITYRKMIIQDTKNEIFNTLQKNTIRNGMACTEHFLRRKDGSVMTASCFSRNLGCGRINVMLTENTHPLHELKGAEYDSLTGFYNYEAVCAQIYRLLMHGGEEYHSCILIKIRNLDKIAEEYGKAFAVTVIENAAMYIHHHYREKGHKVVLGRIKNDMFLVMLCGEAKELVEKLTAWTCDEMLKSYYGRGQERVGNVVCGICHMEPDDTNFDEALENAERAIDYAERNNKLLEVYSSADDSKYRDTESVYITSESEEKEERIYSYDNRLVSFAVALLANAKNPESSLDVLLQRLAWQYKLDEALVCRFIENKYVKITNRYERGKGIVLDKSGLSDVDEWDGFFQNFDSHGCMKIADTEADYISDKDRLFFKAKNIGSAINILLYNNDELLGYLSMCKKDKVEKWNKANINTLVQLSKIIALFLALSIRNEMDEERYNILSRDALTGLYVYTAFLEEVKEAMKTMDASKVYAVVCSDIDNFSYINENFGYDVGNELLKGFARSIQNDRGAGGINCHLEGDKFLSFTVRDSREELETSVEKLNKNFAETYNRLYPMSDLRITTGIYYIENPNTDITHAVTGATHVWKAAKRDKYTAYKIYTEEFKRDREKRLSIIGSVHKAIENGEIEAFLQPKFSMRDMCVIGAEALARWRNPDGSYKFPSDFIPVLEEAGYIVDVDFCIYEQVLQSLARWKKDGRKLVPISVNFSRAHMRHENFVDRVKGLAEKYEVDPKYIEIEITESTLTKQGERMKRFLAELRGSGYKIDIDDFGTGYSSLNMLLDAPADIVKIDKSFIDNYDTDSRKAYIDQIGHLILTANKEIIFEGVETYDQIDFLTNCGYDMAQGYVFSRPIPTMEFENKFVY